MNRMPLRMRLLCGVSHLPITIVEYEIERAKRSTPPDQVVPDDVVVL